MKKVELFDFAKMLGAHIAFSGAYDPTNTYVNARIKQGHNDAFINGGESIFGRSENADLDEACKDLAAKLTKAKTFQFRIGGGTPHDIHVPPLKHTTGHRGYYAE